MKTDKTDTKKNHPARWFLYCCLHNVLELIVDESKLKVQGLNKSATRFSNAEFVSRAKLFNGRALRGAA